MSTPTVRPHDPYKNFKFKVKWDGKYVLGVSKVSGMKRSTKPITHRSGGDNSTTFKSPGQTEYDAITLERGVTFDVEFERWANKIWNYLGGPGSEASMKDFRKDILIEVCNDAGQVVLVYKVFNCWVSEYKPIPDLDASAGAIAIQSIKLENEGFVRDYDYQPPDEPTFNVP